jgi:peptidoglycan/xylan/chitin deacetylase (PgdA/CDA1 family)
LLWRKRLFWLPRTGSSVYLTFDDGPTPGVTDWVLDELAQHGAQATFFLVGNNVRLHPGLTRRILRQGHAIGNHTYNHANGWKTPVKDYLGEVAKTDAVIHEVTGQRPRYFRPPYGKAHPLAWRSILADHEIVLWDILPGDFDPSTTPRQLLHRVTQNVQPGSIIVLHDSLKCEAKLRAMLPPLLQWLTRQGYHLKPLPRPVERVPAPAPFPLFAPALVR